LINLFIFQALSAQTQNAYSLGRISEFAMKLDQLKYTLSSIDKESYILDLSSSINYYGLKALGCIRTGNLAKSFDSASFALQQITKKSPTLFFTFPGYSAVTEAFILLLQWLRATQGISQLRLLGKNQTMDLGKTKIRTIFTKNFV